MVVCMSRSLSPSLPYILVVVWIVFHLRVIPFILFFSVVSHMSIWYLELLWYILSSLPVVFCRIHFILNLNLNNNSQFAKTIRYASIFKMCSARLDRRAKTPMSGNNRNTEGDTYSYEIRRRRRRRRRRRYGRWRYSANVRKKWFWQCALILIFFLNYLPWNMLNNASNRSTDTQCYLFDFLHSPALSFIQSLISAHNISATYAKWHDSIKERTNKQKRKIYFRFSDVNELLPTN